MADGPLTRWRLSYDSRDKQNTRVNVENAGRFDEFVLMSKRKKNGALIHAEVMDTDAIWLQIGDAYIWVTDAKDGVRVTVSRGEYGEPLGSTECRAGAESQRFAVRHEVAKKRTKRETAGKRGAF